MKANTWTLAEAQARLSDVIDRAASQGLQTIIREGRDVAVVSASKRERKTRAVGNLAEFFAASPLRGSGLKIERLKDRLREIDRPGPSDDELWVGFNFNYQE